MQQHSGLDGMKKNAIIVGMPRSGTSLTAGIFSRQGYHVSGNEAKELQAGDGHNPFGYFEAKGLIDRNVELFSAVGYPHDNTWKYFEIDKEQAERLVALSPLPEHEDFVNSQYAKSPWMWKDPRLCYTLGYWWQLMRPENTGVLYIRRSEEEIFESFIRLGWRTRSDAARADVYRRAKRHWDSVEKAISRHDIPHLTVNYEDYIGDPAGTAALIGEFFGLDLTPADLNVKPNLNHSSSRPTPSILIRHMLVKLPQFAKIIIGNFVSEERMGKLFPEYNYTMAGRRQRPTTAKRQTDQH
jgi:hypothetical protein